MTDERHLASRSSFSCTASRINLARPYVPTSASSFASTSGSSRTAVGFRLSGGRPIGRGVAAGDAADKKTMTFSIDALNDDDYIDVIVYGGKPMAANFTATDGILDDPNGMPIASRVSFQAEKHRNASMERLAAVLNAAQSLIDKIEDVPSLFFGMEDTCEDEFGSLRDALNQILQVRS